MAAERAACGDANLVLAFSGAGAATVAADGFVVAAAIANGSFFGAPGSPALMLACGVASHSAAGLLGLAELQADNYSACLRRYGVRVEDCVGELENFKRNASAIATVLRTQGTAAFVAAGIAWIPWVGQAPMWVIAAALALQLALIASLIA